MNPFGLLVIVAGAAITYWGYEVTRISEQLDSIGSKTRMSEVEPAEWNVMLTRLIGVGIVFFGIIVLLS